MKKILLATLTLAVSGLNAQNCNEIFISEYCEGSYNNKAIEVYNPTSNTIDLTKYRLTRWQNGTAPVPPPAQYSDTLKGTIGPNEVRVIVLDRRNASGTGQDTQIFAGLQAKANFYMSPTYTVSFSMSFNGDDALSLDKNVSGEWIPVDIFGKIGEQPKLAGNSRTIGWSDSFPHNSGLGTWYTIDKTLVRRPAVVKGITQNPSFFNPKTEWKLHPENMWDSLGSHRCDCNKFPASTKKVQNQISITVLPNPASSDVTILSNFEILQISVTAMNGQVFLPTIMSGIQNGFRYSTFKSTTLANGVYLVKVMGINGEIETQKLQISK